MTTAITMPLVETTHGKLRGATDNGVHVFKGVRYAESTAGANRFLPPQPVRAWTGVQDALAFGGSAPQHAVRAHAEPFYSWYSAIQPISEDCLCLKTLVQLPAVEGHNRRPVWRRNAKQSGPSLLMRSRPSSAASDTSPMVSAQRFASSLDLTLPHTCSMGLRSGA